MRYKIINLLFINVMLTFLGPIKPKLVIKEKDNSKTVNVTPVESHESLHEQNHDHEVDHSKENIHPESSRKFFFSSKLFFM